MLSVSDRRYNLSDFEEFLDEAGIPDQEAQEKAAREWAGKFAETPLVVDTNTRIPPEMLDAWMRDDPRFRNTWNRQRHDLKDQSQSGYDLALACFGIDAGLPEQRIVDLIVHHRSLFARSQRTRVDYFQRTIAKANERTGGAGSRNAGVFGATATPAPSPTTGPVAQQGAPVAPEEQPAPKPTTPDPDRAKALLCEQISQVLGIGVVRIVKITGKEPQYRMELAEGEKIDFPNVGKLISQDCVRLAIAATVGRIIPKITKWDRLAQAMLDACIVEAGTEEMEWEGAARMYIQHYLSETGFIQCIEGQRVQEQRRPMVIDGKITICASDIQVYVNKTMFQNLSVKALAGMLAALGAKSMRVRGQGFKEQSRWVLPPEEFDAREYSGKGASLISEYLTGDERTEIPKVSRVLSCLAGGTQWKQHLSSNAFLLSPCWAKCTVVAVAFPDVVDGFQEHAAGTASRVVDRFPLLRVEDLDHQPDHRARRVKLASLLVREVGELLDQIFIRLPKDVRLGGLVPEADSREVLQ